MNNTFKTTIATIQGKYPRSRFPFNFQNKLSFNAGDLVPVSITEILPGDTVNMNIHSLTRMATPIAPIMDNIKQDFWFFFVPRRLVDTDWDKFITYSDWDSLNDVSLQKVTLRVSNPDEKPIIKRDSLGHYFGLPIGAYEHDHVSEIIAAPFKTYPLIYNYFFRDENYQEEIFISENYSNICMSSEAMLETASNGYINITDKLYHVNEFHDQFTSVLPTPQKGPEVLLPLGDYANIMTSTEVHSMGRALVLGSQANMSTGGSLVVNGQTVASGGVGLIPGAGDSSANSINRSNLIADLSTAVSASINDLRESALVQHFMEQLARTGSRLQEYYLGFWGVVSPDARLQMPEYIAGTRFSINVSEVLQTAGYTEANDTTLGTTGAVSRTVQSSNSLFTKSFVEHGYLVCLTAVRHDLSYSQGIPKLFTKKKPFDYYVPIFNGLSEQPVKKREVLAPVNYDASIMKEEYRDAGALVAWDADLGFNEAWYEYRYRNNRVTGMLNPVAKDGLDYWTLAKAFDSRDITGAAIRVADSTTLARALSTGTATDQFIMDYYEECDITRVMPVRSIPGLSRF